MKRSVAILCVFALLAVAMPALASVAVRAEGVCALVGDNGSVIIAPGVCAEILPVTDGLFAARTEANGLFYLMDATGKPLTEAVYEDVYEDGGMLLFRQDGLYGVMDSALQPVYAPQYTRVISNCIGGFLALRSDPDDESADGVYLLDGAGGESVTGTTVLYGLNSFSGGYSAAIGPGTKKSGYLNARGLWALSPQYAYGTGFVAGLAVAAADSGVGVIDTQGNWVVSPKYESVSLSEGNGVLAALTGAGRVTLFDTVTMSIIADIAGGAVYARTERLKDMALVTVTDTVSLYSRSGEVLAGWPGQSGVALWSGGTDRIVLVSDEEAWLLDGSATPIAGPFSEITVLSAERYACVGCDGYSSIYDRDGRPVLETQYDSIGPAAPGLYIARDASGAALIDEQGVVCLRFTEQNVVG